MVLLVQDGDMISSNKQLRMVYQIVVSSVTLNFKGFSAVSILYKIQYIFCLPTTLHNLLHFIILGRLFDRVDLIKPVSNVRQSVRIPTYVSVKFGM